MPPSGDGALHLSLPRTKKKWKKLNRHCTKTGNSTTNERTNDRARGVFLYQQCGIGKWYANGWIHQDWYQLIWNIQRMISMVLKQWRCFTRLTPTQNAGTCYHFVHVSFLIVSLNTWFTHCVDERCTDLCKIWIYIVHRVHNLIIRVVYCFLYFPKEYYDASTSRRVPLFVSTPRNDPLFPIWFLALVWSRSGAQALHGAPRATPARRVCRHSASSERSISRAESDARRATRDGWRSPPGGLHTRSPARRSHTRGCRYVLAVPHELRTTARHSWIERPRGIERSREEYAVHCGALQPKFTCGRCVTRFARRQRVRERPTMQISCLRCAWTCLERERTSARAGCHTVPTTIGMRGWCAIGHNTSNR